MKEKKNIKETPFYAAPSDRGNNWRNEIVYGVTFRPLFEEESH